MWIPIIHMSTRKPISPSQINELLIQLMVASKLLRWCQPWFGGGFSYTPCSSYTSALSNLPPEHLEVKARNGQMDLIGRVKH